MRVPVLLAALLLASLASVPASAQEDTGYAGPSVDLQLFGHIYDMLDVVPMNAHPMDPAAPDLARGYSQPTVAPQYGAQFNRIHFFNSMGPVEYNASLAEPRIHPERGLALDLDLDPEKDVVLHWFMSADAGEVRPLNFEAPAQAGAVPRLTVRAEVRLGNDIRQDLRAGELVAQGEATLDLVTAPGAGATEIVVNLGRPLVERIPAREGFNLGVSWYQAKDQATEVLMPGWNLHTGAAHPNRLVLPVRNPIYLYFVEPQFQEDKVAINAAFNSPLGNYDVDPASLTMELTGPGGFRPRTVSSPVLIQHTFQHNEHNVATLNGWLWDRKADEAPPGNYSVTVRGCNLQATACAQKSAAFTIAEEGRAGRAVDSEGEQVVTRAQLDEQQREAPRRSPGFELAALALGALALLPRRRG